MDGNNSGVLVKHVDQLLAFALTSVVGDVLLQVHLEAWLEGSRPIAIQNYNEIKQMLQVSGDGDNVSR